METKIEKQNTENFPPPHLYNTIPVVSSSVSAVCALVGVPVTASRSKMNALTGIEAHRVDEILRHSGEQLKVLSYVPTAWNEDMLNEVSCQPVANGLTKTWYTEEQLKTLGEEGQSDLGGGKDIQLIKSAHRANRATCRNLLADRESLQTIMKFERNEEDVQKVLRYLGELKTQVYERMTTTVEDEAANRALLHDLTERERLMEETRDALQTKLHEVRMERDHVSFSLDQTMRKTQVELQDIKQSNQQDMETVQKEMSEAITKATADHEMRLRQLQDQVGGMQRQAAETIEKNREEEQRLRKDKARSENALNAKIAQYDEDMSSRKVMLDELQGNFDGEYKEYMELKDHFDRVDADIGLKEEEDAILATLQRRMAFGFKMVDGSATKIQTVIRGHIARVAVSKMKSKGKKKKK